jgi:hypothetical protein
MNEPEIIKEPVVACEKQWQPSRMESLKNYNINIKFLSIGCLVEVGCMSIPFTNITDAMEALQAYIDNPYEERQKWEKLSQE